MKLINKLFTAISFSLAALTLSSCYNEVFYNISKDVPPEDATVLGPINSVARYNVAGKEYLVTYANDGLRYKLADDQNERKNSISVHTKLWSSATLKTNWKTYSIPKSVYEPHFYDYYGNSGNMGHTGTQIIKVLADTDTLYLVTSEYTNNTVEGTSIPSVVHLWAVKIPSFEADGETWSQTVESDWTDLNASGDYLKVFPYDTYTYSAFSVFSTNAIKPEHRKVFVRKGSVSEIAKLSDEKNGTDYTKISTYEVAGKNISPVESVKTLDTSSEVPNSAVYFNNQVIFLETIAAETNETIDSDPTVLYFSSENKLKYITDKSSDIQTFENTASNAISCFAVTSDYLIIGCANYTSTYSSAGGFCKAKLNADGIPTEITTKFETNATTQIPSTYLILTLLNTDPRKSEIDSTLYASINFVNAGTSTAVSYENRGLWAYYPESIRGNWNRE